MAAGGHVKVRRCHPRTLNWLRKLLVIERTEVSRTSRSGRRAVDDKRLLMLYGQNAWPVLCLSTTTTCCTYCFDILHWLNSYGRWEHPRSASYYLQISWLFRRKWRKIQQEARPSRERGDKVLYRTDA